MASILKPRKSRTRVDKYLDRAMNGLEAVQANPRLYFRLFTRHDGAIAGGQDEFFYAMASLIGPKDADDVIVYALPEGTRIDGCKTSVITMEGPALALLGNETLLYYLTTGTRAMTLASMYPGTKVPWIFMGARDQSEEEQAIFARSFRQFGIPTTIEEWDPNAKGTMNHASITTAEAYRLDDETERLIASATDNPRVAATIRATIVFHLGNPNVPVYVLGDYATRSEGCFETFRKTYEVCKQLGIEVKGGRIDISKADLDNVPIVDRSLEAEYQAAVAHAKEMDDYARQWDMHLTAAQRKYQGVNLRVIAEIRRLLDGAGLNDFELVVSSNMKLKNVDEILKAGANLIGIGEDAVYFLNQGECNYTSDAVAYFENGKLIPFAKEGRELSRLVSEDVLAEAETGFKIDPRMVRVDLAKYL